MSKLFRHSILLLALLGLALSSVAHANAPSHDSAECSVCIYQPNTDLQQAPSELPVTESSLPAELIVAWVTVILSQQNSSPFQGRAPPFSA